MLGSVTVQRKYKNAYRIPRKLRTTYLDFLMICLCKFIITRYISILKRSLVHSRAPITACALVSAAWRYMWVQTGFYLRTSQVRPKDNLLA